MSIRFDVNTDRLLRTTDILNYNAAYTWMAWVMLISDLNATSSFLALCRTTTFDMERVGTGTNGTTIELRISIAGSATFTAGSALTLGTWYHIAMVRESATSLKLYLNGNLDATLTTDISARAAVNRMEVGAIGTGNAQRSDSRVAAIKAWSGSMTEAEVRAEVWSHLPRRFTDQYAWWPGFPGAVERLRDYSVNARNWTEVGTLTDEAGPPLPPFFPSLPVFVSVSAASNIRVPVVSEGIISPIFGGLVVR